MKCYFRPDGNMRGHRGLERRYELQEKKQTTPLYFSQRSPTNHKKNTRRKTNGYFYEKEMFNN